MTEKAHLWFSRKMLGFFEKNPENSSIILSPDGKIGTFQTSKPEHGCWWDDVEYLGEYDRAQFKYRPVTDYQEA